MPDDDTEKRRAEVDEHLTKQRSHLFRMERGVEQAEAMIAQCEADGVPVDPAARDEIAALRAEIDQDWSKWMQLRDSVEVPSSPPAKSLRICLKERADNLAELEEIAANAEASGDAEGAAHIRGEIACRRWELEGDHGR